MNKQERMEKAIYEHGKQLNQVFGLDEDPIKLSKQLRRIEVAANRYAVQLCNGEIDPTEEEWDQQEELILARVDKITGFRSKGIPVIYNMDPRGYALKIDDAYMREHKVDLHGDWGGFGILSPDLSNA